MAGRMYNYNKTSKPLITLKEKRKKTKQSQKINNKETEIFIRNARRNACAIHKNDTWTIITSNEPQNRSNKTTC